jgi:hypothetical protein
MVLGVLTSLLSAANDAFVSHLRRFERQRAVMPSAPGGFMLVAMEEDCA